MVYTCAVPECRSNRKGQERVSVFQFPRNEEMRRKWLRMIRRDNFTPTPASRVCAKHFKEEDIMRRSEVYNEKTGVRLTCKLKVIKLRPNAVPCIFPEHRFYLNPKPESSRESVIGECVSARYRQSLEFVKVKEEPEENWDYNGEQIIQDIQIKQEAQPVETEITEEYDCSDLDEEDLLNNEEQIQPEDHNKPQIPVQYPCQLCYYTTKHKSSLRRHLRIHSDDKPYKCEHCDYSSRQKGSLQPHMLVHHKDKIQPKDHNKPQIPVQYPCQLCDFTSKYKKSLKRHLLTHSDDKPLKCDYCDYSCRQKSIFKMHLLIHLDDKPFTCDHCDYSSRQKGSLKRHKLIHSKNKPFSCKLCDYSNRFHGYLKQHLLTHSDNKPYKCDYCDYSSRQKGNLKKHIMVIHKKDKILVQGSTLDNNGAKLQYPCNLCDYTAKYKGILIKHWIIHFKHQPYVKIHKLV